MDVTTLALAVDSSQVNSASQALQRMATEGLKAETVAAKFANTAQLQGRALNAGIVKNAAAAADSIKGLTSATTTLAGAQDFSKTTSSLAAAAAEASAATTAVRAFGAAIAASAAAGGGITASFQAPKTAAVQQITQAPVSVLARSTQGAEIDSKATVTASNALDKLSDQAAKAKNATEGLTSAAQAQGRVLGAGVAPNAEKAAASIKDLAIAANSQNSAAGILATAAALSATAIQANSASAAIANMNMNTTAAKGGSAATPSAASAGAVAGAIPAGGGAAATSAFAAAAAQATKQSSALGQANKLTAFQTQQLHFQLHDFAVQVISGQSPLTAFVQQGSQLSGTFGGAAGAFRAVASVITPMTVGIAAAAAAVGTLGYAYIEGRKQSKEFADSITLTGNFAGQTEGQFNALSKKIAENGQVTVAAARDAAQALVKTGEIGPQVFDKAAQATALYSQATGKAADEVAADFAKMTRNPAEFAKEANRSLNFLTAAQIDSIKTFQEQGNAAAAQSIILDAYITRFAKLNESLGGVEGAFKRAKNEASNFKDALFGIFREETLDARIASISKKIADMGNALQQAANPALPSEGKTSTFGVVQPRGGKGNAGQMSALQEAYRSLQGENFRALDRENDRAIDARTQKEATAAGVVIDSYLKRGKAASEYKKKLDELNRSFDARAAAGVPVSKADQAVARTELKKEFTDSKGVSEASQILKAQYDQQIKGFKDALDKEKDALAFHNRFEQGEYQAGRVSLQAFYDDRIASIKEATAKEVAALDKQRAATVDLLKKTKDPSDRVQAQTKLNEIDAQKEKLGTAGAQELELANQEKKASFKALEDQITSYRASLLQLAGDELGAARLRAQVAESGASTLIGQAGGRITAADVARQSTLTEIANQYADAQRRAGEVAQNAGRAEEAAYLAAELGGKSLLDTENAVYAARSKAVDQLGVLAAKTAELARVSDDPKIKQGAADIALAYAKAAAAIDPALNRLRDAQKSLAAGVADTLNSGLSTLGQEYGKRRTDANKAAKDEKDQYDKRIETQQGFLAQSASLEDRARIKKKIKDLEAQRDSIQGESKGKSLLQALNTNVIAPIGQQAFATVNKLLVTDPLQKMLEAQLKSLTEGDGALAGLFKNGMGIKDPKTDANGAILAQAQAANASASALDVLTNAANAAAGAINPAVPGATANHDAPGGKSFGDFTRADRALGNNAADAAPGITDPDVLQAQKDARAAVDTFGNSATNAAADVVKLAASAGKGTGALGLLPSIVSLFQAAVSAMSASSATGGGSGGGLVGGIASLFSGSSGAGGTLAASNASALAPEAADVITSFIFHSGGVVGGTAAVRSAPSSIFAGAARYHTGGIAGSQPDGARAALAAAALKHGEVPAILMKREEVLRRDDPRHRDNLGADLFSKIMAGEKPWEQSLAAQAAKKTPDNSVASLLKNIAGDTKQGGENSASVLGGLLARLGVEKDRPAVASALQVAGARELGGPVSAGKLYRVNEKRPELLNVSGKQYLMMGSQGGKVDANLQQGAGGRPIAVTNNFTLGAPTNHSTQRQMALAASRSISDAARRNG